MHPRRHRTRVARALLVGLALLALGSPFPARAAATYGTANAFPNLTFLEPTDLKFAPDGSGRVFVVERAGTIRAFANDPNAASAPLFLDLTDRVLANSTERGLLGLAFDPNFATNGEFYLNYTARAEGQMLQGPISKAGDRTVIMRYALSGSDPNLGDPNSGVLLFDYVQPATSHNGGALAFGPDGLLYIASGDGGPGGDPSGNAQNTATRLGTILRVDPHGGTPYAIPGTNPFADDPNQAQEIWHWGLRNPWKFSFDRATGDLWIGDVGQSAWEEIDYAASGVGGLNFQWNGCEGTHDFNAVGCPAIAGTPPLLDYPHDASVGGFSITGGYVYRGSELTTLQGLYIYGDFSTGRIWAYDRQVDAFVQIATSSSISSFGEDPSGELYVVRYGPGQIDRLVQTSSGTVPALQPAALLALALSLLGIGQLGPRTRCRCHRYSRCNAP